MADRRHKRDPHARRTRVLVLPVAVLATCVPVGLGVVNADVEPTAELSGMVLAEGEAVRTPQVSRSAPRLVPSTTELQRLQRLKRQAATAQAIKGADDTRWVDEDLTVYGGPAKSAGRTGSLDSGTQVLATGRKVGGRAEIVLRGVSRWVAAAHLVTEEPAPGISMEPCPRSDIEGGLTPAAVRVFRSVCAAFPQISTYGGRDGHGEHVNGEAIDIMTSDVSLGNAIAEFLIANAGEFGLENVIWRQRIWQPGSGWDGMSDRGSATANHYDHVHVKVY